MENKIAYIYALTDPRNGNVKYIGKSNNYKLRYNSHVSEMSNKSRKISWIKSLRNKGLRPGFFIIDEVSYSDWRFWESHYISLYKSWNIDLLNMTSGGDGGGYGAGKKKSDETRKRMSDAQKKIKRVYTKEMRDAISKRISDTHAKRKMLGIKMSEETREKIRQHKLNMSDEYRKKLSEWQKGRKLTDEQKRNLSVAHKNQTNENLMNPVIQYTKDWVFIKEHKGIACAAREIKGDSKFYSNIAISIRNKGTAYGYRWVLKGQVQMEVDNNKARGKMFEQNQKQTAEIINQNNQNV